MVDDLSQYSDDEILQAAGIQPAISGSAPLSIQNANPGNMRDSTGAIASYDSPKAGLAAMQHDLELKVSGNSPVMKHQYGDGYQPTIRNVISTWAPPSENDTDGYVNFVAKHSGINPDQPLQVADVPKIMQPMIHMEGGQKASSYFSKLMSGIGDAIVPSAQAAEDDTQNPQPAAPVRSISYPDQPASASQPNVLPNGNGNQGAPVDLSNYSDAEILQAAGLNPEKPAASAQPPTSQSPLAAAWDLMKNGTSSAINGGAQLESNIIAPFLSDADQQKLRDAGVYDVKHPEIKNAVARAVAESPLGAYGQAVYGGIGAPLSPVIKGAGDVARAAGVPQNVLDLGGAASTIAGVAGPGNFGGKSSIATPLANFADLLADKDIGTGDKLGNNTGFIPAKGILSDTSSGAAPAEPLPASITTTDSGEPLPVTPRAQGEGAAELASFLNTDGIDLNKVANDLEAAQKIDPNARAIDVMAKDQGGIPGAPNVLGLAKSIAQSPGLGRSLAAEMVNRGHTATQDIGNSFERALAGSDLYNIKNDAIQSKEGTGPLYDAAYSHPGNQNIQSPVINRILKTNAGTASLRYAAQRMNADMSNMVNPDPALAEQAALAGQAIKGGVGSGLKLKTYQYIKEGFDDQISKAYNAGENGLASSIKAQKNALVNQLDSLDATKNKGQLGAYSQARKAYSTASRIQESVDNGRKFMTQDPEAIKSLFNDPNTPLPEKRAYAAGAGRSFQDMIDKVRDGSNPVQAVWKQSLRKRLQPMMTPDAYKQLSDEMALHQVKARVNNIVQGSPTYANEAFSAKPPATVAGSALRMFGNALEPGMIIGKMGDILDKSLQKQATKMSADSKAVAMRYLTSKDPAAIRYLAKMQKRKKL